MNELLREGLFNLLSDHSVEVVNEEIQHAYENFIRQLATLNQSEAYYQNVYRTLSLTRIEFQSLQTQILYGQEKKCV